MLIDNREVRESTPPAARLAGSSRKGWITLSHSTSSAVRARAPFRGGLVAPCAFDPAHQLLGSQLLQVVGGTPRSVLSLSAGLNLRRQAVKPRGRAARAVTASARARIRGWFRSIPDAALAHPGRPRQGFQGFVSEPSTQPGPPRTVPAFSADAPRCAGSGSDLDHSLVIPC
jgi:hypothetical protein